MSSEKTRHQKLNSSWDMDSFGNNFIHTAEPFDPVI